MRGAQSKSDNSAGTAVTAAAATLSLPTAAARKREEATHKEKRTRPATTAEY